MKLWEYLKDYKKEIVFVVVSLFLNILGVLAVPRLTVNIIDIGIANGDKTYILTQGLYMVLVTIMTISFAVISIYYSTKVSVYVARDIRKSLFRKVEEMKIEDFERIGTSSLIIRNTDDVSQIQNILRMGLRMILRAPLMFIGAVIMATRTNTQLTKVFLYAIPLLLLGTFFMAKLIMPIVVKMRKTIDEINRLFRERITGIRVIRAFDKEIYEEERFSKGNKDFKDIYLKAMNLEAIVKPIVELIMNGILVAIVFFGSNLILKGNMFPGELVAFIQYGMNIMFSFMTMMIIFFQVPRAKASFNRIVEVLEIEDLEDIHEGEELGEIESVEFKNVSFAYPEDKNMSLENISFSVDKGKNIAIIGSTGSGKTTLANLMVRFYDIESGQILINGKDIKEYSLESLRREIGYTEQKASLISGTVESNILMGSSVEGRQDDVYRALSIAQGNFVLEDEEGIKSPVAQRGRNFSGGQKQRISIARGIYKEPSLFLIDDSFSALDYQTERKLREELLEKSKGAIKIIITQRAQVAYEADEIILLDKGRLVAIGNHDKLVEESEEYREILDSQNFNLSLEVCSSGE